MKTFVISLEESHERRKRVEKLLLEQGVTFLFFDAVNIKTTKIEQYPHYNAVKTLQKKGYKLTNPEIGCYLSHYKAWQNCIELNEPIFVLEDNIKICTDLTEYLAFAQKNIQTLGIIKLGSYFTKRWSKVCAVNNDINLVKYNKGGSGASSYMITPLVAQRYVSLSTEFYLAVDDFMDMEYRTNIPLFTLSPNVIARSTVQSTIGSRKIKGKLTIRKKLHIELGRVAHQIKRERFNLKFYTQIRKIKNKIQV